MKKISIPTIIFFLAIGCKKEEVKTAPLSSLKLVNVVTGGSAIRLNNLTNNVNTNANANFALLPGNPDIYIYPVEDSLNPWYNSNKQQPLEEYKSYSLFLGGTPDAINSLFVEENIPIRTDSTAGIRFVNLSPGASAVNITLSTSPDINEFENVAYGAITEFKSLPATSANTSYIIQARESATNTIVATITMSGTSATSSVPRFKNSTLVLRGIIGGTPAAGLTRVNNF